MLRVKNHLSFIRDSVIGLEKSCYNRGSLGLQDKKSKPSQSRPILPKPRILVSECLYVHNVATTYNFSKSVLLLVERKTRLSILLPMRKENVTTKHRFLCIIGTKPVSLV